LGVCGGGGAGGSASNLLCGTEEMKLYFTNLATVDTTPPNVNCNSSNWSLVCEPGWAAPRAIVIQAANNSQRSHDDVIPLRNNNDPQPCCAGFFCPQALACMIRKNNKSPSLCPVSLMPKSQPPHPPPPLSLCLCLCLSGANQCCWHCEKLWYCGVLLCGFLGFKSMSTWCLLSFSNIEQQYWRLWSVSCFCKPSPSSLWTIIATS
jgi:hypothetical protein